MKIDRPRGGERPAHATHDQLLVVRFAAGDTTDVETTVARELLATCPDCRLLASDLLAIARATADLPHPVRRRDFRISAEQAAHLRRPAPLRWLSRVSGAGDPRPGRPGPLIGLQRLAGAAVAVGLVMALVTSPVGHPGLRDGLRHVGGDRAVRPGCRRGCRSRPRGQSKRRARVRRASGRFRRAGRGPCRGSRIPVRRAGIAARGSPDGGGPSTERRAHAESGAGRPGGIARAVGSGQ